MSLPAPAADLDPSLYLVTAPAPGLDGVVAAAVAGGVSLVQVRDKDATTSERARVATRLRSITSPHGVPVVVDDDLEAAQAVDGVHVGPSDTSPVDARRALGSEAIVGWSIEDFAQLDDGANLAACTYVAVSPVWATPSKTDTAYPWGLDGVRRVVAALAGVGSPAVVGIGGIDAGNAGEVIAAGADGVAVISAVCGADDPGAAARTLRRAVDQARVGA